jgi:hypothetical protein
MNAKKPALLLGGLALCAALLPTTAAAQPAPITPEVQVSDPRLSGQYLPALAVEPDGSFVVAWTDWSAEERVIRVRLYTASGTALTESLRVSQTALTQVFIGPSVAIHPSGNFLVTWEGVDAVLGRVFDASGAPRTDEIEIHRYPGVGNFDPFHTSVAVTAEGFAVAWSGPVGDRRGIFLRRYDSTGAPLGSELRVDSGVADSAVYPEIATDAAGGLVVVWEARRDLQAHVFGRLLDAAGMPRSGELRLDEAVEARSVQPSVAIAPDGGFLVAWERNGDVASRLFGADGTPRGPAVRLNEPGPTQEQQIRVATDPGGGFVAVWSFQGSNLSPGPRGRRIDAAGRPSGAQWRIGDQPGAPTGVTAAFSAAGEFAAAWHGIFDGSPVGIFAQRFRFPEFSGADPCVVSRGRLTCDTLRAGEASIDLHLDTRPGSVPLLGNLNGDLQDDPCYYRAGNFFCDLDHDGRGETVVGFGGAPGDVPLLGDVNGDGRDDACLRQARRFVCDTAHNGGTAEVQILLGLKTDLPLLGDVDGDGDDDPCLYRAGRFLCDTAHDGGGAEVAVAFGVAGDTPLLGDMDGDGREDFCVFGGGRFLCDTAHDGGAAEVEIFFGEPGAVPLLGNVDGF